MRRRIKLHLKKVFSNESPLSGDERGVERRDEKQSGGRTNASSKEESSSEEASQEGSGQEACSEEESQEEVTFSYLLDSWVDSRDFLKSPPFCFL